MLLAAGMIAYLGAFPAELRLKALASWNKVRARCAAAAPRWFVPCCCQLL